MSEVKQEWWIDNVGRNMLRGVHGDSSNPPILPDDYIFDFLRKIPAARESFNRLYPTMLPDERARLDEISKGATHLQPDIKAKGDAFQRGQNTVGIFTTGPRGGRRYGGNGRPW